MIENPLIIAILICIISVILILCIVHISSKMDELCKISKEILEELKKQNKN